MRGRNIDAVALVFLTLLLLVVEAVGSRVTALASTVSLDGWCPRTAVRRVIVPALQISRVEHSSVPSLRSIARR